MKKIAVAGAGIGGISAALNLADKGFDVTVFEAKAKENCGHDWCDSLDKRAFDYAGIGQISEDLFSPHLVPCYKNPKKTVKVVTSKKSNKNFGYIDRKILFSFLVDTAEKRGVKFVFGATVKAALIDGNKVAGLVLNNNGREEQVFVDLVIDSAGADSPARKTLPSEFGIKAEIDARDILITYRAFFDNTSGETATPAFTMYFDHCNKCGVNWVITKKEYADVLISGFGSLNESEIETALSDFRSEYPFIGNKLLRGGTVLKIPMRRTLPLIVCNGYAAVGDSAVMVEPLTGSGISLSLKAGKILADTVCEIQNDFSIEALWKYQYKYYKDFGEKNLINDSIKKALTMFTADDFDYLFEKKILTCKEFSRDKSSKYAFTEFVSKLRYLIARPKVFAVLLRAVKRILKLKKICSLMPENYSEISFAKWETVYEEEL